MRTRIRRCYEPSGVQEVSLGGRQRSDELPDVLRRAAGSDKLLYLRALVTMLKGADSGEAQLAPLVGGLLERSSTSDLRPLSVANRRDGVRGVLSLPRGHRLVLEVGFGTDLLDSVRFGTDMAAFETGAVDVELPAGPAVDAGFHHYLDRRRRIKGEVEGVVDVVEPSEGAGPSPPQPVGSRVDRAERAKYARPPRVGIVQPSSFVGAHLDEGGRLPALPQREPECANGHRVRRISRIDFAGY